MNASTESWVTKESVLAAIKEYLTDRPQAHFTTSIIADRMGAGEYSVRRAFGWLQDAGSIASVPCVSAVRYTRARGKKYEVAVYTILENLDPPDLSALHRVFCCWGAK
jgi:hypothetical protein